MLLKPFVSGQTLSSQSLNNKIDEIFPDGVARVGILAYPTFSDYVCDDQGKITSVSGLFPTIFERIFRNTGIMIEYRPIFFRNVKRQLRNGDKDFIAGIFDTSHRRDWGQFVQPVHLVGASVVTNFSNPHISNVKDLSTRISK